MKNIDLINILKEFPLDMQVAIDYGPYDKIEIKIRHYESEHAPYEEFDYISLE